MIIFFQILVALAPVIFLVGLVKPNWIMFWMKEPDRLWSTTLGLLMFMAGVTGYSEMRLKHKTPEQIAAEQQKQHHQRDGRGSEQENDLKMDRY